jgi:glycosyltransferase involved in cell wall biosynthesis
MEYLSVSLCLTTYNEGSNIDALLNSISRQSIKPGEIVICDGGSTDNTLSIIEKYRSETELNIVLIQSENRINISKGRNIAINNSNYDIIAVTDGGCVLDDKWLSTITKPLLEDVGLDIVGGYYKPLITNEFHRKMAYVLFVDSSQFTSENFIPSSRSLCFRKSIWLKVGGYPEHLKFAGEDTLFIVTCKENGFTLRFVPNAFVYWNMRDNLFSMRRAHFVYGYGEGEASLFPFKYLFYFFSLLFPLLLIIKRNKYRFMFLQYILIFEMFRGWLMAKLSKIYSTLK